MQRPSPKKRRNRWAKRIGLGLVSAAILGGLVAAWWPKPLLVDTAVVKKGELIVAVDEVGKTRVRDRYVVAAPLAGGLLRIELRAGDAVEAGAVLARITPMESPLLDPRSRSEAASRSAVTVAGERQAQAAIARAEVAAQHANDELEETKKLVTSGSLASDALTRASLEARLRSEELASAKFAAQMATHEAAMARAALARFEGTRGAEGFNVPSPAGGRVLRVISQSAGPVQPGTALLEIGDPNALEVVTEVLSADAVRIEAGAKVLLERWGGPTLHAHVRRVEPSGQTRLSALGVEEQRVSVVVDLDEPHERWAALGDGFRVEARIIVESKQNALQVPLGAVLRHDGGWATYTIDKGRAHLVPVKLGARSESAVEIESGVPEGATVIVHPSERVKEDGLVAGRHE